MRRTLLLAILFTTAPAFASGECLYLGEPSSPGALICQAGVLSRCDEGRWTPTDKSCAADTMLPNPPAAANQPAAAPYLLHIMTATYNAGSAGTDVVYALRSQCDGKPACSVAGDARLMDGDPAPRLKGRFSVIYQCTTGFQTRPVQHDFFAKHATIKLGCP